MKETTLLKIALSFSLIGLALLYFLSNNVSVKEYAPANLNKNIGENVKAEGIVEKISASDKITIIEINQETPLKIVLFDKINATLKEGDKIEVIGKTEEYKGSIEIVANRIRKLD